MNTSLEVLAHGFLDGGCDYVSNFPGFHSHTLFELLSGKHIAINEKVAYEMAFGASLGGARSVVTFKNFGLNVAADPFLNSLICGVEAGLVLVVTDDIDVEGSQFYQDSRHYRDFFGGLWLEPSSIQEAYDMARHSFEWSEALDIPVVIRLSNSFFNFRGSSERKNKSRLRKIRHPGRKYILHPVHLEVHKKSLSKKIAAIQSFVDHYYADKKQSTGDHGCIAFGSAHADASTGDILRISTYPLPQGLVTSFVESKKNLSIVEEGDAYGLALVQVLCCESPKKIEAIKPIKKLKPLGYRTWSDLENLFQALVAINPSYVVSDLTQFTNENTGVIQACLCLGACVPIGIGLSEAGVDYPFCISGDTSLVHAGLGVLLEAKNRGACMGVVIIDNGGSWCTGGQMPATGLALKEFDIPIVEVDYKKMQKKDFIGLLTAMKVSRHLSVLVVKV